MTIAITEREAIATICLMAAFADGNKDDAERDRLKEIYASLNATFSPTLYSRVLLGQVQLEEEVRKLHTPALRTLAYEMAVGVCDADGHAVPAEQAFLERLRQALSLDVDTARHIDDDAAALVSTPLHEADPVMERPQRLAEHAVTSSYGGDGATTVLHEEEQATQDTADVNAMILKYAVLNGGLELLPQSLATMAIVPLQMKMVYRIGLRYDYQLDQGHIKELLATVGVGMTSQVVETYARKLVGGLVKTATGKKGKKKKGKKKGKKLAKVAGAATGAAMSFASTYALGQVANTYYAGGRQLSTQALKGIFRRNVEQGKMLYDAHRGDVEASARTTDLSSLLTMIRSPQ